MSVQQSTFKTEVPRLLAWVVCFPSLVFWPFLSALPFFTLLAGPSSALQAAINLLLLATGFWPVVTVLLGYQLLRNAMSGLDGRPNGLAGLVLGVVATVWTLVYLIVSIASR